MMWRSPLTSKTGCWRLPKPRRFQRDFGAGVEHSTALFVKRAAFAFGIAVLREAGADSWRDVEPAEKSLRQEQLMERVGSKRGVAVRARSLHRAKPEIARGVFALVKKRRYAELLPQRRELHVGQTLDRLERVVELWLGEQIQAEVGQDLVQFEKGFGLGFYGERSQKIADDLSVACFSTATRAEGSNEWWFVGKADVYGHRGSASFSRQTRLAVMREVGDNVPAPKPQSRIPNRVRIPGRVFAENQDSKPAQLVLQCQGTNREDTDRKTPVSGCEHKIIGMLLQPA